jgi:DNA-binding protein HU-beta
MGGRVMNKAELVEEVSAEIGLTKKASREAVDAITSVITDTLARQEKVTLVGFGTFQVVERKARTGRNPQTGEIIQIPAKKAPKFKPGKGLRERVR